MKVVLRVDRKTHAPVATAISGAAATIVNDAVMTPGDVIKQRLQLASSPYKGIWDCIQTTYRAEGLAAFYRSYKTTVSLFSFVSTQVSDMLCNEVLPPPQLIHLLAHSAQIISAVSVQMCLLSSPGKCPVMQGAKHARGRLQCLSRFCAAAGDECALHSSAVLHL
jgi:hypothetical protein